MNKRCCFILLALTRDSLRMASSSVSQDDIDNDYEKNSRRSRIRTARARQINPSGSRTDNNALPHDEAEEKALDVPAGALHEEEEPVCDRQAENTEGPPQRGAEMGGADDTSPKPMCRAKDKRSLPPSKMHHGNKGTITHFQLTKVGNNYPATLYCLSLNSIQFQKSQMVFVQVLRSLRTQHFFHKQSDLWLVTIAQL